MTNRELLIQAIQNNDGKVLEMYIVCPDIECVKGLNGSDCPSCIVQWLDLPSHDKLTT